MHTGYDGKIPTLTIVVTKDKKNLIFDDYATGTLDRRQVSITISLWYISLHIIGI